MTNLDINAIDREFEEAEQALQEAQRQIEAYHTLRNEGMQEIAEESRGWLLEYQRVENV